MLFLVLAVLEYIIDVFPIVPQEIGGGKPPCALLDQEENISKETAQVLVENKHASSLNNSAIYEDNSGDLIGNDHGPPHGDVRQEDRQTKDKQFKHIVRSKQVIIVYSSDKRLFFKMYGSGNDAPVFETSKDAISVMYLPHDEQRCSER